MKRVSIGDCVTHAMKLGWVFALSGFVLLTGCSDKDGDKVKPVEVGVSGNKGGKKLGSCFISVSGQSPTTNSCTDFIGSDYRQSTEDACRKLVDETKAEGGNTVKVDGKASSSPCPLEKISCSCHLGKGKPEETIVHYYNSQICNLLKEICDLSEGTYVVK